MTTKNVIIIVFCFFGHSALYVVIMCIIVIQEGGEFIIFLRFNNQQHHTDKTERSHSTLYRSHLLQNNKWHYKAAGVKMAIISAKQTQITDIICLY
jgi:hypothetical protein